MRPRWFHGGLAGVCLAKPHISTKPTALQGGVQPWHNYSSKFLLLEWNRHRRFCGWFYPSVANAGMGFWSLRFPWSCTAQALWKPLTQEVCFNGKCHNYSRDRIPDTSWLYIYIYLYTSAVYVIHISYIYTCMPACRHTVDGRTPAPPQHWTPWQGRIATPGKPPCSRNEGECAVSGFGPYSTSPRCPQPHRNHPPPTRPMLGLQWNNCSKKNQEAWGRFPKRPGSHNCQHKKSRNCMHGNLENGLAALLKIPHSEAPKHRDFWTWSFSKHRICPAFHVNKLIRYQVNSVSKRQQALLFVLGHSMCHHNPYIS